MNAAELAVASVEIECRAAAIRRNTEAALLDELLPDPVLLCSAQLAQAIEMWSRALR